MDEHDHAAPTRLHWPRGSSGSRGAPDSRSLYVHLLDADADLADQFDVRMRLAARQLATAKVLNAQIGECDLGPWFDAARPGLGLLVLDGLVAFETTVADRTATELLGSGDLIQPPGQRPDDLLERTDMWRMLRPTRFALLDAAFVDRVRPWPQIVQELLRRLGRRAADLDALRTIMSQPRLEVRLVLLMWHLAARWGRVEPAGIRVTLPLTHRMLGQLIAAERPSISHALARLGEAGLLTGSAGDLHLHGSLETHLETLIEQNRTLKSHGNGARSQRRRIA